MRFLTGPYIALLLVLTMGAGYGLTNPTYNRLSETRTYSTVEPLGQDTDGDGVASTSEGAFDLDGDGLFTQVEADHLGMSQFIRWGPSEGSSGDSEFFWTGVCNAICIILGGGVGICQSGHPHFRCPTDAEGECTGTQACKFPCSCPLPGE